MRAHEGCAPKRSLAGIKGTLYTTKTNGLDTSSQVHGTGGLGGLAGFGDMHTFHCRGRDALLKLGPVHTTTAKEVNSDRGQAPHSARGAILVCVLSRSLQTAQGPPAMSSRTQTRRRSAAANAILECFTGFTWGVDVEASDDLVLVMKKSPSSLSTSSGLASAPA
jgi:hypothetical protein